jgi:molybdopterin adenylyltransferase
VSSAPPSSTSEPQATQAKSLAPSVPSGSLTIGLVSISDRASAGVYEDKGIPGLVEWFTAALKSPWRMETRLIPDEQAVIERTLIELIDTVGCELVLTTGGTGPARRDVTPEATVAVAHKVLPGFGEQMRQLSLQYVPTAILSRQVGAIRGKALMLNLPGQPKAIKETLDGIFPAVPYCIDLIGGPYIETHDSICKVFRPKSALAPAGGKPA